jgi:hypothetical protein
MYNVTIGKTKLVFILTCIFFYIFFLLITHVNSEGQISENFNGGDFTYNPVWNVAPSAFILNNGLQLQSNNTTENSSFWLASPKQVNTERERVYYYSGRLHSIILGPTCRQMGLYND